MTIISKNTDTSVILVKKPTLVFIYRLVTLCVAVIGETFAFICYGFFDRMTYYTNQTAFMILLLFAGYVIGDLILLVKKEKTSIHFSSPLEMALTLYILVTFLGYWLLLSKDSIASSDFSSTLGIIDFVGSKILVHGLLPLLALFHFIFFSEHGKVSYKQVFLFLIYPFLYLVFLLIRAQVGGMIRENSYYPYGFIDLDKLGPGYFTLVFFAFLAFYILLGLLFVFLDKLLAKKIAK